MAGRASSSPTPRPTLQPLLNKVCQAAKAASPVSTRARVNPFPTRRRRPAAELFEEAARGSQRGSAAPGAINSCPCPGAKNWDCPGALLSLPQLWSQTPPAMPTQGRGQTHMDWHSQTSSCVKNNEDPLAGQLPGHSQPRRNWLLQVFSADLSEKIQG